MGVIESFSSTIGTWFSFVGACVVGPGPACRPFLAFLALSAMAGVALYLVVKAYNALQLEHGRKSEESRIRARERQMQERVRKSVAAKVAPRPATRRGWRMPA